MIRTVALLALVASSSAWLFGSSKPKLWNPGFRHVLPLGVKTPFIVEVPKSLDEALDEGWDKIEGPPQPAGYEDLTAYMGDPTFAILIDEDNGNVAGYIILIPVGEVTPYYDMAEQGFTLFSLTIDGETTEYYTTTIYFVSADKATRKYDKNQVLQTNNVAFQSLNGQLEYVPTNLTDIKNNATSVWKQQNCIKLRGTHYFYEMTETTTCDKPFRPYFAVYDEKTNQLIGLGMLLVGKTTGDTFEYPNADDVKMIVNHGPQCLYDLVEKYGAIRRYMFFIDQPIFITCT